MRLSRHVLKYLYIYYLPSGLFVVVSWVGFLIPPEVVPGRMAMLITLFLVLINIFNIVTTNSPNVEGMTAIGQSCNKDLRRFDTFQIPDMIDLALPSSDIGPVSAQNSHSKIVLFEI